jgi:hypothetical protein
MIDTFFDGSASDALAALVDVGGEKVDPAELERLAASIRKARKEGR